MFIEIPASAISLALRKPVYGIGINDAKYIVSPNINGKQKRCEIYKTWKNILKRCYSGKYHKQNPSYSECGVCYDWLTFSNFYSWMKTQDWKEKELDKDIIKYKNKIYHPDLCVFVDGNINATILSNEKSRGDFPQGVYFNKRDNAFVASIRKGGKKIALGYFDNAEDASNAYIKEKHSYLIELALTQSDKRVKTGLVNHAKELCRARGISL